MQVETVTTQDRSLLQHVRQTLAEADSALLCVAFVQERGVHLLKKEIEALRSRNGDVRLLVTTTFATTDDSALGMASQLGARVKVLNPGSGSYHPKVYLGLNTDTAQAVVGSANMTSGLATNVEMGVWMKGRSSEVPLAKVREFSERLWNDPRAEVWLPNRVSEPRHETFAPDLYPGLLRAVSASRKFLTLGQRPKLNVVTEISLDGLLVETERSKARIGGSERVPASMFNLAWDYLRTHGELSNKVLEKDLRVNRSSAVCAILARLPGVEQMNGPVITLRWRA
ncbi:MAG: phospholipase D-like domain-containing protein [Myxococcales bacterium]